MSELTPDQVATALDTLNADQEESAVWKANGGNDSIEKSWTLGNFQEAFAFLTRVAFLAEAADHHPVIWNVYNQVKLTFSTVRTVPRRRRRRRRAHFWGIRVVMHQGVCLSVSS